MDEGADNNDDESIASPLRVGDTIIHNTLKRNMCSFLQFLLTTSHSSLVIQVSGIMKILPLKMTKGGSNEPFAAAP